MVSTNRPRGGENPLTTGVKQAVPTAPVARPGICRFPLRIKPRKRTPAGGGPITPVVAFQRHVQRSTPRNAAAFRWALVYFKVQLQGYGHRQSKTSPSRTLHSHGLLHKADKRFSIVWHLTHSLPYKIRVNLIQPLCRFRIRDHALRHP